MGKGGILKYIVTIRDLKHEIVPVLPLLEYVGLFWFYM